MNDWYLGCQVITILTMQTKIIEHTTSRRWCSHGFIILSNLLGNLWFGDSDGLDIQPRCEDIEITLQSRLEVLINLIYTSDNTASYISDIICQRLGCRWCQKKTVCWHQKVSDMPSSRSLFVTQEKMKTVSVITMLHRYDTVGIHSTCK